MILSINIKLQHYLDLHYLLLYVEYSNFFLIKEQVAKAYLELCQTYKMELFGNVVIVVNYFRKKLHLRCLTGLWVKMTAADLEVILFNNDW